MGLFPHLCFELEFWILFKDLRWRHSPYLASKVQLMNKENRKRKKLSTRIKVVKKSLRRKKKRERTKIVIAY